MIPYQNTSARNIADMAGWYYSAAVGAPANGEINFASGMRTFPKTVETFPKNLNLYFKTAKKIIKNIIKASKSNRMRTHRWCTLAKKKVQKEFDK